MVTPDVPNPSFFNFGQEVSPDRSTLNSVVGDLALIRVSYIPYLRGQTVRLIKHKGSEWVCKLTCRVEGDWTGPDGIVRHCDSQEFQLSATSLEAISESEYRAFLSFKESIKALKDSPTTLRVRDGNTDNNV